MTPDFVFVYYLTILEKFFILNSKSSKKIKYKRAESLKISDRPQQRQHFSLSLSLLVKTLDMLSKKVARNRFK